MEAIIEGLGIIAVAAIMIYGMIKFVQLCNGDDNAD